MSIAATPPTGGLPAAAASLTDSWSDTRQRAPRRRQDSAAAAFRRRHAISLADRSICRREIDLNQAVNSPWKDFGIYFEIFRNKEKNSRLRGRVFWAKEPADMRQYFETGRTRRTVLQWTGGGLAALTLFGSRLPNFGMSEALAADLGEGDIGILNYAYALEQLEAGFYTMVVDKPYGGISDDEKQILTDIRDHEQAHVDFLKGALADKAIPMLEADFSKVDFASRESVLTTAKTFEDLGVAAYNGAGKLLQNGDYLLAAGRIVSVEARHAAAIRDLLQPGTVAFAGPDVVDDNGLDGAMEPAKVLAAADPFIKTEVTAKSL